MSVGATATVPLHAPEPPRACVSHAEVRPAGYIGADTPRPEEARILDQPNAVPAWIAPRGCGCGTRWSVFSTPTIRFPLIAAMRSPAHACASAEGEGSHLLSFLPLGVGNSIKSPHSWQGEQTQLLIRTRTAVSRCGGTHGHGLTNKSDNAERWGRRVHGES